MVGASFVCSVDNTRCPVSAAFTAISAVSTIAIVLAVGLVRLAPWGWYGAMLYTGVGLAFQIALFANGRGSSLYLAIHVIEAFYLNQADVRRIFQRDGGGR